MNTHYKQPPSDRHCVFTGSFVIIKTTTASNEFYQSHPIRCMHTYFYFSVCSFRVSAVLSQHFNQKSLRDTVSEMHSQTLCMLGKITHTHRERETYINIHTRDTQDIYTWRNFLIFHQLPVVHLPLLILIAFWERPTGFYGKLRQAGDTALMKENCAEHSIL